MVTYPKISRLSLRIADILLLETIRQSFQKDDLLTVNFTNLLGSFEFEKVQYRENQKR
jgi:hypothetical protein